MLNAGMRFGDRYEIVSHIGAGGMGEVYRARDLRLGRDVAIKILPEHLAKDPNTLTRFEREAKVLASLSHSNILAVHDFLNDHGISVVVMELLEGETLRQRMSAGNLSWKTAMEYGVTIAEALALAHSRGIIHRDLKPENIFLTADGAIKILDFGLARIEKVLPKEDQSDFPTLETPTDPGTVLGTIHYMSPEQLRGESVDARSDIFSLGCVLYEMLTGERPFSRKTYAETVAAVLKERPAAMIFKDPATPAQVEEMIHQCLEKKPAKRPPSAREVALALKSFASGQIPTPEKVTVRAKRRKRSAKRAISSIAVLPFENASGDTNTEYLSDGITESIISSLSQLPKLRVMARSTVFRYKGQKIDPLETGAELNVAAVLTGRVVQRSENLNILAELVDVEDGSQLWGEQYTRKMADIFAIQDEISREISEKLRPRLSGEEKKLLEKRYTKSTEAYELYLKGRYYWSKRNAEGLKKGIEYLNQAVEKDPHYSLAYAALADCFNLLSAYGVLAPNNAILAAKKSAIRSLEIDPTLAEGHEALAHVKMLYDWEWDKAEEEFKRALQINPNYATAHQRYAIQLATLKRFDDGFKEIKKAQQLDPLSLIINTDVALILYLQSQWDQSIEQSRKALELDGNFSVAHFALGLALEQKGLYEEATNSFVKGVELSGDRSFLSALGHTCARSGKRELAFQILKELIFLSHQRYISPYRIAVIWAGLDENDRALEWLQKAYQDRSVWLIHLHLRVDPRLNSLRSDSRFTELMQKMGFDS